jgi:para-aminobenzoate synthetase component I
MVVPVMSAPWFWRSFPLNNRTGATVFAALFESGTIGTLLESPFPPSPDYPYLGRFSICAGEPRRMENGEWRMVTPEIGEVLPFLRSVLPDRSLPNDVTATNQEPNHLPTHLPFVGGWLGWLGYDLAWEIERLPTINQDALPFPVAFWYEPESFAVLDHEAQVLWLAVSDEAEFEVLSDRLSRDLTRPPAPNSGGSEKEKPPAPNSGGSESEGFEANVRFLTEQAAYEAAIGRAKEYIRRGDIFQTNISLRFETETSRSSWEIYQALQKINPSPFASYWRSPFGDVVSCSPERLVSLDGDRIAQTRPIAGTRARGKNSEEDLSLALELRSNEKECAEHIMLVDLERNDLGRVCEFGSVVVDELLAIERYSHVMHLVSNVRGKLRSEFDAVDLIRATFPGGTITGCPKVRCMEIIEELEPVRRSLFYGSCGYLDIRGQLDLNILIRTLLFTNNEAGSQTVWGQVGAGIVADSVADREWHESLQKAKAQLKALGI